MIMRITWGRIHPGKWDEYEKTYNATVVAKSRNIKGLRGGAGWPKIRPIRMPAIPSVCGIALRTWRHMSRVSFSRRKSSLPCNRFTSMPSRPRAAK
jgi:hypothetical protein